MFENESYTVTSYEDMKEVKEQYNEALSRYKQSYKNFLITCLCEVGFAKKKVREKRTGSVGFLEVREKSYFTPYEIKFYPLKKNGETSLNSKYFGYLQNERLAQDLTDLFELVGDENES